MKQAGGAGGDLSKKQGRSRDSDSKGDDEKADAKGDDSKAGEAAKTTAKPKPGSDIKGGPPIGKMAVSGELAYVRLNQEPSRAICEGKVVVLDTYGDYYARTAAAAQCGATAVLLALHTDSPAAEALADAEDSKQKESKQPFKAKPSKGSKGSWDGILLNAVVCVHVCVCMCERVMFVKLPWLYFRGNGSTSRCGDLD